MFVQAADWPSTVARSGSSTPRSPCQSVTYSVCVFVERLKFAGACFGLLLFVRQRGRFIFGGGQRPARLFLFFRPRGLDGLGAPGAALQEFSGRVEPGVGVEVRQIDPGMFVGKPDDLKRVLFPLAALLPGRVELRLKRLPAATSAATRPPP